MAEGWSVPIYSAEAMRAAEGRALAHATEDELMDVASLAVARACMHILRERHDAAPDSQIVILAGAGNNGGDALLAGVHLVRAGAYVTAVLCADRTHQRALADFTSAGGHVLHAHDGHDVAPAVRAVQEANIVIDGIVGLGASPGLRPPADTLVSAIDPHTSVVAVDLPSGVDVTTGELPSSHVHADATVTFSGLKACHVLPPAAYACGYVTVARVGVAMDHTPSLEQVGRATVEDVRDRWPTPQATDHKYSRGVLGVIAGSTAYPGAAVLAVSGAIRAGVGMVRYVGPERVQNLVLARRPETVCTRSFVDAGRVQAWLVGSGVESDERQDSALEHALRSGLPVVVDAAAIEKCVHRRIHLADAGSEPTPVVTPHAGELAAALDAVGTHVSRAEVESRPVHFARALARQAQVVVVLKGAATLVCTPGGMVISQPSGPAWLATAGAGDVLAGVVGALLAGGLSPLDAAVVGVNVHAKAATAASRGGPLAALDVAEAIPGVVATVLAAR
jgi:hydroxyethylthiazole kinase-like uncharacterized protein yjeF